MSSIIKRITRANYYRKIFFDNKEDITWLSSILEDKKSVDTLNNLISSYCTRWHSPEYYYRKAASEICTEHHFVTEGGYEVKGVKNPYFLSEIFDLNKCGVFLDGGAYIGDTIEIAQKYIPNLRLIYAFEPNKETYKKLIDNKRINGTGVKFFNNGLGKKEGNFRFMNDDAGSRISNKGSEEIHVLSAGEFVSTLGKDELPDFIKLDIEGSELDVIDSLDMFIAKNKPDLAISIYHKLEDLWTIPLKLKLFCPEYHIYIRHQSNYFTETICYATTHSREK